MERERITISVKKTVLAQVDKFVDGITIRNRSHAFETLALKAMGNSGTKIAVFLLGGKDAMKAIPATKRYLDKLSESDFDKVFIAVGFLGDKIKESLGDGSKWGIDLIYSNKGEGSGGALMALKKELQEKFLVINTDREIDLNLDSFYSFHNKHLSKASVLFEEANTDRGVYLFEPETLKLLPKGFSMIEDDLFPTLVANTELVIMPTPNL